MTHKFYSKAAGAWIDLDQDKGPVYQGVNRLCARCGQPIPDGSEVMGEGEPGGIEENIIYFYCSEDCEERH